MSQQTIPVKCLCGADPIVEEKEGGCLGKLYKYRCPNCAEKELPWLGQWPECGALQEWNLIAPKRTYRKRTLAYNESGVCIAEPTLVLEWRAKKGYDNVVIKIFEDNGRFYYCYDYWLKDGGAGLGLWISEPGFPSLEIAKLAARKRLLRICRKKREGMMKMLNVIIPEKAQMELF